MIKSIIFLSLLVCSVISAPADPTPAPENCKGHENGLIADPKDPSKFWQCAHGRVVGQELHCPKDQKTGAQTHFDVDKQICVGSDETAKCPNPKGSYTLPYPGDKHKFIQCSDGNGAVITCNADLVYLDKCHTCGYEDDPTCNTESPTVAPVTVPQTSGTGTTARVTGTSAPVTSAPTTTPAVECTKEKELFPDPTDKTKYFICKNGKKEHGSCPDGVDFDPATKTCD